MGKGSGRRKLFDRALKVYFKKETLDLLKLVADTDKVSMSQEVRTAVQYYLIVRLGRKNG